MGKCPACNGKGGFGGGGHWEECSECHGYGSLSKARAVGHSSGGSRTFTPPFHGTTSNGKQVTVAFGRGSREGHTLIADGHKTSKENFYGSRGDKQHDYYDGKGGGTNRGKYNP